MAELTEVSEWTPGIYQLETTDPVEGGPDGIDNLQARQLANRTAYLKAALTALGEGTQPLDATLTALAALATAANQLIYATGSDTFGTTALTAFARTLLDDTDAATARATLGVLAGTESASGLLELATSAETVTGTDAVRATHAAGVKAAIDAAITALVNGSPAALNQLNELATALGNDPNFATTITTALAAKQPLDATLTAMAALATAADKLIYATGADAFATTTLTAFARTLLDDTDAATARATLGLGAAALLAVGTSSGTVAAGDHNHGSTYQPLDATLTALAALATAADKLIYATGSDTFATTTLTAFARTLLSAIDAAAARATLGLGAAALLAVGTSSGTVAAGDHNHGSTYQPLDATLTAMAALATAADKLIYATGSDTFATTTLTAFARTLLDDADAATARATLGAQATLVANDAGVKTALNAAGDAPIYACRAWVNFNGAGTVAIRASGNVSSITDNGTGDYTINFTTAMPDTNYIINGSTLEVAGGANGAVKVATTTNMQTQPILYSVSQVRIFTGGAQSVDPYYVGASIFR